MGCCPMVYFSCLKEVVSHQSAPGLALHLAMSVCKSWTPLHALLFVSVPKQDLRGCIMWPVARGLTVVLNIASTNAVPTPIVYIYKSPQLRIRAFSEDILPLLGL
jgi:hypothetical protein